MQSRLGWGAVLVMMTLVYALANSAASRLPRKTVSLELAVRLPVMAQVMLTAGDRHLAANLNGFRALVVETAKMKPADYELLAGIQEDAARLNPAHEDNYYIGAAILPWGGQVEPAQRILRRAADARPFDWMPLFLYGFNYFHFHRRADLGAAALLEGANRASDANDQNALRNMAAKWMERGYSLDEAALRVEGMAKASKPGGFKTYLMMRADRLRTLARLRALADQFERNRGRRAVDLGELVATGLLKEIPKDRLGAGYSIDTAGQVIIGQPAKEPSKP